MVNHARFAYEGTLHVMRYREYVRANRRLFGTKSDVIVERCGARLSAFNGIHSEAAKQASNCFFSSRILVGLRHVRFV